MGKSSTDQWIEKAFRAKDRETLCAVYDTWAENYDSDLMQTGYLHVPVIAGLVARHVPSRDAAILDAGVGTGSVGHILSILGYNNLSGIDMSDGMLAKAKARGSYVDLRKAVLGEPLDFPDGAFDAILSTGTFTTGHAPASSFDELTRILESGGMLVFTVGTVVWEEQGFSSKLEGLVARKVLKPAETTPLYCPMPYSRAESGFTTRAHVYRKM
jgi:predicted TPR repeat methyltransferase